MIPGRIEGMETKKAGRNENNAIEPHPEEKASPGKKETTLGGQGDVERGGSLRQNAPRPVGKKEVRKVKDCQIRRVEEKKGNINH